MSFEETALRFWQLCHHSRVYVYFVVALSTNSFFWPLRLGLSSSMQSHSCSRLGYVQPVEGANCDDLGNGLRQHLTKNRNLRKMRYDSRLKCSTLMQAGATVLDFLCKTSYTTLAVPIRGDWASIQIASHHNRKGTKRPNPSRDSWFLADLRLVGLKIALKLW